MPYVSLLGLAEELIRINDSQLGTLGVVMLDTIKNFYSQILMAGRLV